MKIAYISYEHPLGITGGGIGTYLGQIARVMTNRGHHVEVFTGHPTLSNTTEYENYLVHRVQVENVQQFRKNVLLAFQTRQSIQCFDIIETGEYGADALLIKKSFPNIPLTVKLHTPSFLVARLNGHNFGVFRKSIFLIKGLLKGNVQKPFWIYSKRTDPEYELFRLADTISSPSKSLKKIIREEWGTDKKVSVVPLPFAPPDALLRLPLIKQNSSKTVICFVGKLEIRKGILVMLKAIPEVLKYTNNVVFRFIGEPLPSPRKGLDMKEYIEKKLQRFGMHLEFTGKQPASNIPELIADCQICVFPSLWENFPNVCLEAMAAGKVVIGTDNGGMADMINSGVNGILVPPKSAMRLAKAIRHAANGVYDSEKMGLAARTQILSSYNPERIGQVTEDLYIETIRAKQESSLSPAT